MQIREATADDAPAIAAIVAQANPSLVVTAETWLARWRASPPRGRVLTLAAEVDGAVVATAATGLDHQARRSTAGFGTVVVGLAQRGRGIGSALAERIQAHLGEVGADSWSSTFFETDAGVSFARRLGFRDDRVAIAAGVDPRTVDVESAPGTETVAARDLGPEAVFAVDSAAAEDEPTAEPQAPMPYDEWRARVWDFPTFTADGSFVALVDGVPAAIALLFADRGLGRGMNAFTATLRAYRGRGLARAAKIASLHWAAEHDITQVCTMNDDTNAPMLAINRRLGYEPIGRLLTVRREL